MFSIREGEEGRSRGGKEGRGVHTMKHLLESSGSVGSLKFIYKKKKLYNKNKLLYTLLSSSLFSYLQQLSHPP